MGKPDLSTALVDAGGGRRSKTAKAEIRYRACLAGSDPFASATVRQLATGRPAKDKGARDDER